MSLFSGINIYYFSGTDNSLKIDKNLSNNLKDGKLYKKHCN
ncbi:hypothetical protein [Clostridium sp. BJN0013]